MNNPSKSMSLVNHLTELRRRLVIIALALIAGTGVSFIFARHIYHWLQLPLSQTLPYTSSFIALSPIEGWLVYFKVSVVTSLFATSPIWLYQFWAFIAPALYKRERLSLFGMGLISALLFVGGALLCYYFIIPHGFQYFVSILGDTNIELLPQMSLYFSFMLRLLIAFGLVFELPLVIIFLIKWEIVPLQMMRKLRPYVVLFAFILAAIMTPPDVFTQAALAIPFIILFEVSLLIAWMLRRRK